MRSNLRLLRQNVGLAAHPEKIQVIELALGDADGEELLQVDDVMTSTATLDRVTGGRAALGHEQYGIPPRTETVRIDRDPPALAFANAQSPAEPELIEARVGDVLSGIDPATGAEIAVRAVESGAPFEPLPTQLAGSTIRAQ